MIAKSPSIADMITQRKDRGNYRFSMNMCDMVDHSSQCRNIAMKVDSLTKQVMMKEGPDNSPPSIKCIQRIIINISILSQQNSQENHKK